VQYLRLPPHHVNAGPARLGAVLVLEVSLYLGAAVGMSYVAGFETVDRTLGRVDWPWFMACLAMLPLAFVGYYLAYRPVFRLGTVRLRIDRACRVAVVAAGFGGFLDHGGGTIDRVALRSGGASEREAKVRVTMLAGMEHGMLALPVAVAAAVVVAAGARTPSASFTLPWLIGPAVGAVLAVWAIGRYRTAFRRRTGWRSHVSIALDAGHLLLTMFGRPRRYAVALSGMLLFWLADMIVLWCSMAAFGFRMNVGAAVVAFGTAMIVTRRNGPLGGVGVMDLALPPTLWVCGAHWGPAVLGTFAYRFFTLWLPLPFALLGLPRLRALIRES
jgi:uncharacterized membrane protein YbhN (UPF0104 family)